MFELETDDDATATTDSSRPHRGAAVTAGPLRLAADLLALIYIGIVAAVASLTGAFYVMFPELGALSWDVMEQPHGRWASSPLLLAITPPLTGLVGTVVTRTMPYGFFSVLITTSAAIGIIRLLGSPVAPAISAGLLPLVLGVTSWWYPPGIVFGSALLAVVSIPWRRFALSQSGLRLEGAAAAVANPAADSNELAETMRHGAGRSLMLPLLAFVAIAVAAVKLTGMRFILFPPLVVIIYEMFSHRDRCPWIGRPLGLPLACFLSAAGGWFLRVHISSDPLAAMLSMAWGITVLRVLKLHVPPALAVALLPMVMTNPTAGYPVAVGIGTTLASGWFLASSMLAESGVAASGSGD